MSVKVGFIVAEGFRIDIAHSAVIAPVIDEGQHELHIEALSFMDDVVKTVDTICTVVDIGAGGIENLEVHKVRIGVISRGRGIDVAEAPDAEDFVAGLGFFVSYVKLKCYKYNNLSNLTECDVDIRVLAQMC